MTSFLLILMLWMSADASGAAGEPARPDAGGTFDAHIEAEIHGLRELPAQHVFDRLKTAGYLLNTRLMYKAISTSFSCRKQEGLNLAVRYLRLPLTEIEGDRVRSRLREFIVAKRIFETFPEDATLLLVPLYERSDEVMRANIVQAAGNIAGGAEIRRLLLRALEDTSAYEEENPDSPGSPLRICDMAYNQIVLRYGIRNVLRNISPSHGVTVRDYHIGILKGEL